ncbi:DUF418 domain-containing protein [Calditrichota bacterium]
MNKSNQISPIQQSERYLSLDFLRGIAVLGILIMNIQSYSMIEAAYINPTAFGDFTGINKLVWILSHIFADQKFMTIFSILYGAGIVLITNRAEAKNVSAAGLHYRRTFWLLVIGLCHAYLLWHGDILVTYAVCALVVFVFRKISSKGQLLTGLIIVSIASILYLLFGWSMQFWPEQAIQETLVSWKPGPEIVAKEIATFQGGWIQQMSHRVPSAIKFQTFIFFIFTGWRAGGLMLIGMALYKFGVLTAERSNKFYLWGIIAGFVVGLSSVIIGVIQNFNENFSLQFSMFFGWQFNYLGSLFVAFAYICLIMLFFKTKPNNKIISYFGDVGRMALSNYLLQTIICTIIFYGHGFGLFAEVERYLQLLITLGIWIVLVVISHVWLKYYLFGPFEWFWRSLTYWKFQPMRNYTVS